MQKADFIAKSLVYLKVEKSEVVLLVMDWSPAAIYIALGASMAGAAIQVVSPKLQAWEMQFPVKESESRFVFSDPLGLHEIDKLMKTLNREYRVSLVKIRQINFNQFFCRLSAQEAATLQTAIQLLKIWLLQLNRIFHCRKLNRTLILYTYHTQVVFTGKEKG